MRCTLLMPVLTEDAIVVRCTIPFLESASILGNTLIYLTVFNDNAFFSCMFLRHYGRIQTDPIFSTFIHFARKAEIIDFIYLRI